MPRLMNIRGPGGGDELTEDDIKLLRVYRECKPDMGVYTDDMRAAFDRVEDLEIAQERLIGLGYLKDRNMPILRHALDRVKQTTLTLDGYRKLREMGY